ncbi:hypothetical protein HHL22_04130 [Hymenobacter sp. RP-2-7]|uniref:histidine kinase n=1 Tax=Hymenobacter polaris TaxID=2682546 RepID=A0A7Y0ABQ3_9BACT|nr:ATP-binding protein [Hymenobacter polaris]NML64387.1 hypothetical protein [Hymenobacter polaris]
MTFRCLLLRGCWLWLGLVGLLAGPAWAQADGGTPPTRFYLPTLYKAHSQNFALAQDRRGVLYAGNFAGVLEYDGLAWRSIPTTDITKVSALRLGRDGRLYVGASGEFGYLRPDSTGRLAFASLSEHVRTRFSEVLAILTTATGPCFVTREVLFWWDGRHLRQQALRAPVQAAFQVGEELYLFQPSVGLSRWQAGRWQPLPLAADAPRPSDAAALLPLADGRRLLATSSQGLYQLAEGTLAPLASNANAALLSRQVTAGAVLRDHSLVLGTARGSLLRLGPSGQLLQVLEGEEGLAGQLINALFTDQEGSLWVALNNGLAQLELPSPLTLFDQAARQTGEINDMLRLGNTLYLAASNGLFALGDGGLRALSTGGSSFALASLGGQLYVGTSEGLHRLAGGHEQALTTDYVLALAAARHDATHLYVGTERGLGVLTVLPGRAPHYRPVPALSERVFGVNEDASGNVWLETLKAGLYRYVPATGQLTHYGRPQGLPTQLYNRLAITSQGVLACNEKGIFRFDTLRQRFAPYAPLGAAAGSTIWLNDLVQDSTGNLWAVNGNKLGLTLYRRQGSRFVGVPTPFRPVAASPINVVYPDRNGVVWFGGRDGLVRYDERVTKTYAQPFTALLRLVETVNGRVLYAGATSAAPATVTLPPRGNDISFDFAAATYPVTQALSFQYQLENYDAGWSEWGPASKKEYTNLPAGDYRFRVRARNVYGTVSREAQYAFAVAAPWYAHWWALGLLGLLGAGLVYWLVRWRLRVLVQEKQSLESLIEQRTEEVLSQKAELENQSEELAVKNDQLEKIDLIVQSINAEVDFSHLFQNILAQFSIIRNMNSASFLVYHHEEQAFRYHALRASVDLSHLAEARLTLEQAEARYLTGAVEIYEHIYLKKDVRFELLGNPADDLPEPKSLITIVLANQGQIEGLITLENTTRTDAFDQRDLSMVGNLKEHLIAAFIKTRLLQNIEHTLHDLKETQGELVRQERLASVGQLTKGIADRIQNPLNYVKNFTESSNQILTDVLDAVTAQQAALPPDTYQNLLTDLQDLRLNATTVLEHSNSTTRILSDMKRLLREKSREFLETDLNIFVESRLRTVQQELKSEYKNLNVQVNTRLSAAPLRVRLLPFELGEALQVIISNAYYAMQEKCRRLPGYGPVLEVSTSRLPGQAELRLRDNGKGIAPGERAKLFSPFFTTKPTSKGTGLGLFMSKDILEAHGGTIELLSQEGEFTELVLRLPLLDY